MVPVYGSVAVDEGHWFLRLWLAAVITGTDVTQGPRVIPAVHLPE
jgi:hypothetical protein